MFTMRRKCDIILIVVIKEVRGYEKPTDSMVAVSYTGRQVLFRCVRK